MMAEKIMTFYQAPDPNAFFQLIRDIRYNRFLDQQEQTRIIKLVELWMDNPDRTDLLNNAKYFADLIFKRNITVPMIGASGAIMGILAAFALYFPNVELMLIFLPSPIKAKYFIPIFVVASLFLGVSNIALTSVAHFAHLGGAIFGFIVAKIWKRNRFNIM
jgi:hypothetical protein